MSQQLGELLRSNYGIAVDYELISLKIWKKAITSFIVPPAIPIMYFRSHDLVTFNRDRDSFVHCLIIQLIYSCQFFQPFIICQYLVMSEC